MKYTNNSYITDDTLKAFNTWLRDMYNIIPSFIHPDGIQAYQLREAITGWRGTVASSEAHVNTIPVWLYRLFVEFMKNQYERSQEFGSQYIDDRQINRSYIVNLLDRKPVSNKNFDPAGGAADNYNPVYAARIERRFTVPEGYDGNASMVKLLVPPEVITWLHRRPYGTKAIERDDLDSPTYAAAHPLLRANETWVDGPTDTSITNDGGYGSSEGSLNTADYYGVPAHNNINYLTSQVYGNFRTNAFFFYQNYVDNGNIIMEVNKNKNFIEFICETDKFKVPFMDYSPETGYDEDNQLIAPKVLVNVTYYKRGVY